MEGQFSGKRVIVTGASSGIGAATARQFAADGARVVLVARNREALDAVAADIGRDRTLVAALDVCDLDGAATLFEQVDARFGGIDILVNNAGCHARGRAEDRTVDELTQMIDVNLRTPIAWSRMVLPYLRRAGGGAIVNVASTAGRVPTAGTATYCASKFGLRAFSLALAEELETSDITVSVVSPGLVDTPFFEGQMEKITPVAFSQPVSSADAVAAAILACARDGRPERVVPPRAGTLCTLGYVFPRIKRLLRPLLERRGRIRKARFISSKMQC